MWFQACIFDLDGVIVDTARYHFLAWKRLADEMGIKFSEEDNEKLKGVSRMESLEIILRLGRRDLPGEEKAKLAALKNSWYVGYVSRMSPAEILPGALDFIKEIRKMGFKTAIGSASRNTPLILERTGIKEFFDAVADGNIVSKAKPDPEVFIKAAELTGSKPERCVVFEDAEAGVEAALSAGMSCVGIGERSILKRAHLVIASLSEMNYSRLLLLEKKSGYEKLV